MDESDVEDFDRFIERNWGSKAGKKQTVQVSATPETRGRGRKKTQ